MNRVIAAIACGFALTACSMTMPSLDLFKSTPATEVLRVESEPPGADARTSQGQSCRTPCELTVPAGSEMTVSYALNGYQPQTLQVRPEVPPTSYSETGAGSGRLQPNPVYAELQPIKPPPKKKPAAKRKQQTSQKTSSGTTTASVPATASAPATTASTPSTGLQSSFPWPDPQPAR